MRPVQRAITRSAFTLALAVGSAAVMAVTCTSTGSGNWTTPGIWAGCTAGPAGGDDVVIANGHTITLNIALATCRDLTISAGTLNSQIVISGTNTLQPSRDVKVTSNVAGVTKSISVGAGTLAAGQDVDLVSSTTSGITLIAATSGTVSTARNLTLTASGASSSATVSAANGSIITNGNLRLTGSGTSSTVTVSTTSGSITTDGNLNLDAGGDSANLTLSTSTGTLTATGTLTLLSNGATSTAALAVAQGTLAVDGSGIVTSNGATSTAKLAVTSGTITFGTLAAPKNLTLRSGAVGRLAQLLIGTGTVNVLSLRMDAGVDGEQMIFSGSGTLNVGQHLNSGGTLTAASGTVRFKGNNVNQTIGAYTYHNLVIDTTGSGAAAPATTIALTGNFTHNGNFTSPCGAANTVTFAGQAPQQISGTATTTTFCIVIVNNTAALAADQTVTLNHDLTIANTGANSLTFTSGRLVTGASTVTLSGTNAAAVSGATGTPGNRYVAGNLRKTIPAGASTRSFEVGTQTPSQIYAPVSLTFVAGTTTGTFTVSTSAGDHPSIGSSTLNAARSLNRWWRLTSTGVGLPSAGYSAAFTFVDADLDAGADRTLFKLQRFAAATWSDVATIAPGAGGVTIQASGVRGGGDFAAAEAASALDHFAIAHDGGAVNCQAEAITIAAHLAGHTLAAAYTGTVALTTSTAHGDWSVVTASGTLANGAANDGAATYTFAAGDAGNAILALKNPIVETVNIDVADASVTEQSGSAIASEDASLSYAEAGFQFLVNGLAGGIGTQISGKPSDVAPGAQTLELQAIRTDTATGACAAALDGAINIDLRLECLDPAICLQAIGIGGTPVSAGFVPVSLDFGDATDSTAPLVLNYADAGRIRVHARYDIPLGSGAPSGSLMLGSSAPFVARPFGFDLDFADDRQNNGTGGVSFAADASGGRYVRAGEEFATTLTAVVWQAADDSNLDGVPDGGANLANNAATPNFGRETLAETAIVTHTRILPTGAGAETGVLSGGSGIAGFSGGAATAPLAWSEVGIIDLRAALTDSGYLDTGVDATGVVHNVGRFYPDRFSVSANTPSFAHACVAGGFTYLDQTFHYATAPILTVTALNTAGGTTKNYGGTGGERFWKLNTALAGRGYSDASAPATLSTLNDGTIALAGDTDFDGAGALSMAAGSGGDDFVYDRGAPTAPFDAAVRLLVPAADLTDSDGVCYDRTDDGTCDAFTDPDILDISGLAPATGRQQRFGRLTVTNAFGSELLPLAVPLRTEFFDGAAFVTNGDDSCTTLPLASGLKLRNPATAGGAEQAGTATMTIPPSGAVSVQPAADPAFAAGLAALVFGPAPGAGNTGFVDLRVDLNNAARGWLQFDWDGTDQLGDSDANDDDPSGRASFGVYAGSRRTIYIREQ